LLAARQQPLDKVVRHVDDSAFAGFRDLCWKINMLPLEIHLMFHVIRADSSGRTPPKQL
jgi:hypothetical protein